MQHKIKYRCITSMNQGIYDNLGSYMIDTWLKNWPSDSELVVYAENVGIKQKDNRLKILDWFEFCQEDQNKFSKITNDPRPLRFSKKGFSWLHAIENPDSERIVWIDSDITFYKKINYDLLDGLLPSNKLIALFDCYYQLNPNYTPEQYLDVNNRGKMAAESGFVIIDTIHPKYKDYVKEYRNLYLSKETDPALVRRYDGEVCLVAARNFLDQVEDLSLLRTSNKTQTPLNRSKLSVYFQHHKGGVKDGFNHKKIKEIIKINEESNI